MAAGKALAKWVLPLPSVWRLSFAGQTTIRCKARPHLTLLIFLSVFQFVLDFGYTLGFKALFPCFLLCKIWLGIHWNKWEKLCAPRWMERTARNFMGFLLYTLLSIERLIHRKWHRWVSRRRSSNMSCCHTESHSLAAAISLYISSKNSKKSPQNG